MIASKVSVLALVLSLGTAFAAYGDARGLGEVEAPGAATGRYMGGRPGVERPLHHGYSSYHHRHYRHWAERHY